LLLGLQNGVLDLRTRTLTKDCPSIVTKRVAANFNASADCPRFKKFMKEISRHDAEYHYLRRILGYLVCPLKSDPP
jgi:phage/plasmid-associated DNA primase